MTKKDGQRVIELNAQRVCPYLNENKLCKLVIQHGEDILSETCTVFPRKKQYFKNRTESSLEACCPAVVDFWNIQDEILFTEDLACMEGDRLFQLRNEILRILKDKRYDLSNALMIIFYILLDQREGNNEKTGYDVKELSDTIDNMEFVLLDSFDERNELLLDLADNYRRENMYAHFLEPIAALAEQISDTYDPDEMKELLIKFHTKYRAFEPLMRNYLVAEVFESSLSPNYTLDDMIMKMEWITLEYATTWQALFLSWMQQDNEEITYEMVQKHIVILARMTGYEDEDIKDYMEKEFASVIWEWGYLALIVGNR